ncbi:MAG: ribonuclease P protein component [Nitrospinaceae bacterium]
MGRFTFKKDERLAKRPEFERVMAEGQKTRIDRICILFLSPNGLNRSRLGIIASRKIGNSPIRNRAKRKIREVFRHLKGRIRSPIDIVVISGKDLAPLPFSILEKKFSEILLTKSKTL